MTLVQGAQPLVASAAASKQTASLVLCIFLKFILTVWPVQPSPVRPKRKRSPAPSPKSRTKQSVTASAAAATYYDSSTEEEEENQVRFDKCSPLILIWSLSQMESASRELLTCISTC